MTVSREWQWSIEKREEMKRPDRPLEKVSGKRFWQSAAVERGTLPGRDCCLPETYCTTISPVIALPWIPQSYS